MDSEERNSSDTLPPPIDDSTEDSELEIEGPPAIGLREIQKNRRNIKVDLEENTLFSYIFTDLWQIVPLARDNNVIHGKAFFLILRISEQITSPLTQGLQKKAIVPLLDILKPLTQKGWLFLSKQEFNLLALLRQLAEDVLEVDFGDIDYTKKDLLDQFTKQEHTFLCLKYLSPELNEFSEAIRKGYQNLPDLPGSISNTLGLIERILKPNQKGVSLEGLIQGLNIVKYRRYLEIPDLLRSDPGIMVSTEEFDVSEGVQTEIRRYLKDCEAKIAVLSQKRSKFVAQLETDAQKGNSEEDLVFFYEYSDDMLNQAHKLLDPKTRGLKETEPTARSFTRDKVFPLTFLLRFVMRFLEVMRPLLTDQVPLGESTKRVFAPDVFGTYFEKIERAAGHLATGLQSGTVWNYQEYLFKKAQEPKDRNAQDEPVLKSIDLVIQSLQMIQSILKTLVKKHTVPKGFTPGPVNQRHLSGETLSIPYLEQSIEQRDIFMGRTLGETLFAIIEIINSLLTYFQSDQSVSESEGLIALDRELFALAKIVKRIGTPGYYQRVKLRYQLS